MCMNQRTASNANNSVELKGCTRLMRSAIIAKASQDEQQNQTTITKSCIGIQNYMSK